MPTMEGGHVEEVILENFKSYEGQVRIGPFKKFTCIVGQNGTGKSNLLDAIAFVLCCLPTGSATARRRGAIAADREHRLQNLVHRKETENPADELPRTASVALRYDPGSAISAAIVFKRTVLPGANVRFEIDGQETSESVYRERLQQIRILSEARNFFVFQGDVEAAAWRQGRDLSNFFEQISGSDALQERYDQCFDEKTRIEEDARRVFSVKRNTLNEKKQVSQQKAEAERYQRLEEERQKLHLEFYLFKFQILHVRSENVQRLLEDAKAEREPFAKSFEDNQMKLRLTEQTRAAAHLSAQKAAKELASTRARLEGQNPEVVDTRQKLASLEENLQNLRQQNDQGGQRLRDLEDQQITLNQKHKELESVLSEQESIAQKKMPFTAEQLERFERTQQEANRMTTSTREHLRALETQIRVTTRDRLRAEREVQETAARRDFLRRKVKDLTDVKARQEASVEQNRKLAEDCMAKASDLRRSHDDNAQEKNALVAERETLCESITEITAASRQVEAEIERTRVADDLQRLFQGARGRIVKLHQPHENYVVAINVALGSSMNCIVTDTAQVARRCVQYLKDKFLDAITFLPMDNLKMQPVSGVLEEAVRAHAPHVRLALHCIRYDEELFSRAFHFLLNDVVIAETLEHGRQFFNYLKGRGLTCQIVTKSGETISRNANYSFNSDKARDSSATYDLAALAEKRDTLSSITRRLHEIHRREATIGVDQKALEVEVQRLVVARNEGEMHLQEHEKELVALGGELQDVEVALARLELQLKDLVESEGRTLKEQRDVEEDVARVVSEYFRPLGEAMGIQDVWKYERELRKEREIAKLRSRELARQLGSIKVERDMITKTLEEMDRTKSVADVAECEAEIQRLRSREAELQRSLSADRSAIERLESNAENALEAEREAEKAVLVLRQEVRDEQQRLSEKDKRVSELAAEADVAAETMTDLIRQSLLEGIEVPLIPSAGPGSAPTVDLRQLPAEKRRLASSEAASRIAEDEYRATLQATAAELERAKPNYKAAEQLSGIQNKAQEVSREAVAAQRSIEEIKQRFEAVRRERRELYMKCYDRVSQEVNEVYNRLTYYAYRGHHDGGSAFLDVEDLEEPWNGGVKFTAIPPTKRFSDISSLSGGERALAALALLFAVQAYQKPPLLVLDEVDAHLDPSGVQALACYIADFACQTLVVSLRSAFFTRSEALVGVSKDSQRQSSVIFTVDLVQFRQPVALPVGAGSPARVLTDVPAEEVQATMVT